MTRAAIPSSEPSPRVRRVRAASGRLGLLALFWTAVAFLFGLPDLAGHAAWRQTARASLAQWWSWGLLTPLILGFDAVQPARRGRRGLGVLAQTGFGAAVVVGYEYLSALLAVPLGSGSWSRLLSAQPIRDALRGGMLWAVLVYALILGTWRAYSFQRRFLSAKLEMERLQRGVTEARLAALRTQLDPHFLFNALNTISAEVDEAPVLARRMIGHLADLLRASLDTRNRHELPLADEIALLRHYLAIQLIRFEHRLAVEIDVPADLMAAAVPGFVIQPLVENAIRHGTSPRLAGGRIGVVARREGDRLDLAVWDDGVGLRTGWSLRLDAGLGLSITRERIESLYGDATRFDLVSPGTGGTRALLSIPFRILPTDHPS